MSCASRFLSSFLVLSYCLSLQALQAEQIKNESPFAEEQIFSQNQERQHDKQFIAPQITTCGKTPYPYYITLRHIEANGVGYNQGYTTLAGFFRPTHPNTWVPFLDIRYHLFNNGKPAANAGLGLRYLGDHRVWGINGYYDYRKTNHQHYNQISVGLESLGKIWDFRINGYLPVGKKTSSLFDTRFNQFIGHYLYTQQKYEFAMQGANAEIGAHINRYKNVPLYFAIGPYYLENKGTVAWGGEARLSATLFDSFRLEGNTSYDNVFKWIAQGQVSLVIPFGSKKEIKPKENRDCSTQMLLASRSIQPVDRNEIIVIDRNKKRSVALDPATGQPYYFVFVDNQSSSDGTFESPYPTLALAQVNSAPNQIIYVFPGDGTTNGMNAGIILKPNQNFWGSGNSHNLITTLGSITIPNQSVTPPQITNTLSNCVVLANGNDVSGFNIIGANGNGIFGSDANNIHIDTCLISNSAANGIELDYTGSIVANATLEYLNIINSANDAILVSGTGTPSSNLTLSASELTTSLANGIEFIGNFATNNCTISNNIIQDNIGDGVELTTLTGTELNINLSENQMINNTEAMFLKGNFVTSNITINNNVFSNNSFEGIDALSSTTATRYNLFISNNYISGSVFAIDLGIGNLNPSFLANVIITNNTVNLNQVNALRINDVSLFNSNFTITGNTFNNSIGEGVLIGTQAVPASSGITSYNISDNIISNSGSTGIRFVFNDSMPRQALLTFQNNEIFNNDGFGVTFNVNLSSTTSAFVSNNTLFNNLTSPGFHAENTSATSTLCLTLENNDSDTGYDLVRTAGSFSLAPLNVDSVNSGTISRTGTITSVPTCP